MGISTELKNKMKDDIAEGNVIYTPTAPFTYNLWTGMVYIVFDPVTGSGNYVIGEGLNGGYTVEQFPVGWSNFWRTYLIPGLTATIITPTNGQQFTQGDTSASNINWSANYTSPLLSWTENLLLSANNYPLGNVILKSGYGTSTSVGIQIKDGTEVTAVACTPSLEGRSLPATSGKIGEEMHIPLFINKLSGIFRNRFNGQVQYNEQDDIYSHIASPKFIREVKDGASNINNPWIDPKTGKYWNMSISFAAFDKHAKSVDHEKYYINMRWVYGGQKEWFFGKKVWIKNPVTRQAVLTGILDYGPAEDPRHLRVAGASPEALEAIGAVTDSNLEYCWAENQDIKYGKTLSY